MTRDKNSGENQGKIIFADTFSGKVSNNKSDRQVSWLVTVDLPSHPPVANNGNDASTRQLLTVARQPVNYTRFPIKQAGW